MRVQVFRDAGVTAKPDIVSPLSSDLNALLQLGRTEMDKGSNYRPVTLQTPFILANVGDIVSVYDRLDGVTWRGVVMSIQHGMNENGDMTTVWSIWREPS